MMAISSQISISGNNFCVFEKQWNVTAFGDSAETAGAMFEIKTPEWAIISIMILQAHKKKEHMVLFVCPILLNWGDLAAILYVDNTDVSHISLWDDETTAVAHESFNKDFLDGGTYSSQCF